MRQRIKFDTGIIGAPPNVVLPTNLVTITREEMERCYADGEDKLWDTLKALLLTKGIAPAKLVTGNDMRMNTNDDGSIEVEFL